jgi:hypothetical protein
MAHDVWARRGRRWVTGAQLLRRRFAGADLSWCSGLGFGRDQALEVEHDVGNSFMYSRGRIGARFRASHGEGGSGSWRQGECAHAEGDMGGRRGTVRSLPHQDAMMTASDRRLVAPGRNRGGAVLGSSGSTAALGHRGELGEAVAAEGSTRERTRLRKRGAIASACGSFAQQPPHRPRTRAGRSNLNAGGF